MGPGRFGRLDSLPGKIDMTEILRTPDERFDDLPGYPFEPRWLDDLDGFEGLRMHAVDEGPRDAAETFVCLHGQPTWSYLYRKMIPVLAAAGRRVVAPDLFGFGRSDKPADDAVYTFDFHRRSLLSFLERLERDRITLVVHDWGGLLGLTLPMEMPERIERLLITNTILGTGDLPLSQGFLEWREWANAHPDMDVAKLMRRTCPTLTEAEAAAYGAPFPDARFKGGVRRFPNLVPDRPDAPGAELSRRARAWLGQEWSGASFMAVGLQDPVLGAPAMRLLRSWIRGCPEPVPLPDQGHFAPEQGDEIARLALAAWA